MTTAYVLEAAMLICFGLAWPVANLRMLQTRRAMGKGLPFTLLILTGYVAGASAKLVLTSDGTPLAPVFWLYVLNAISVATNLALQWHFGRRAQAGRGVADLKRPALLVAILAVGLWMPLTVRAQALCPMGLEAAAGKSQPTPTASQDRRFATAYSRFARLADRGDAAAASAALFMLRNGKPVFGSDWSASEGQQIRWNALAINAARHRFVAVANDADD
jgi:hypothetical protein